MWLRMPLPLRSCRRKGYPPEGLRSALRAPLRPLPCVQAQPWLRHRPCFLFGPLPLPSCWGDKPDGSLWRALPDTVSHTFFPYNVPSVLLLQDGGHSLNPDVLGWPALLDCRIRLTASLQPPHLDAAGGGQHRLASAIGTDIDAKRHRPRSFSLGARYHRPKSLTVS